MSRPLVLSFPEYEQQALRLAQNMGGACEQVQLHRFPDGESLVRLPPRLPGHVIFCRSLDHPNDKLVELMLAASAARELGAERLTLVAPYLCYMRQDIAFHPGEAVSQRILGKWLAQLFDEIITVDPHLHRTPELGAVLPETKAVALTAAPLMSRYLTEQVDEALLIGPDAESIQWVRQISEATGFPFGVAAKTRLGDRAVEIKLPDMDFNGHTVVLVDDIVSSGHTLATAADILRSRGALHVHCLITHPLFSNQSSKRLARANIEQIWSTDSVSHATNAIQLASLLAAAIS